MHLKNLLQKFSHTVLGLSSNTIMSSLTDVQGFECLSLNPAIGKFLTEVHPSISEPEKILR